MNPNEITFDIEAMSLSEMMATGDTAEMTKEIEESLQVVIAELASIQPIPNRVLAGWFDIPHLSDGAIYAMASEMGHDGEKSSGPISEINIANIL